jgi:DNA polymerase III alpha subunit
MKLDNYGRSFFTEQEIFEELYKNPELDLDNFKLHWSAPTVSTNEYNKSVKDLNLDWATLSLLDDLNGISVDEFHSNNQSTWLMPQEYQELDIVNWLLDRCETQEEKQRVGQELILFQARNLIPLLKYMKYLVDTLKKNNIVFGVGRGSSVASYVLYLIGVHKINSLYYDLGIAEFLK